MGMEQRIRNQNALEEEIVRVCKTELQNQEMPNN